MIVTVTLNPSMDKTGKLKHFEHGGKNSIYDIVRDAAGHGIVAAKTLKALDREDPICTGFLGGINGERINMILQGMGIQTDFVKIAGDTRTNLKVVEANGFVNEFNEPGPTINAYELEALKEKILGYASSETVFLFSGSLPPGVPTDVYNDWITEVKAKGASVIVDVDTIALKEAVKAKPDVVKPTKKRLEEFFDCEFSVDEEGMISMAKRIVETYGVTYVIVARGLMGALCVTKEHVYRCTIPILPYSSPVGADAAMNAALASGIRNHCSDPDAMKLALGIFMATCQKESTQAPTKEDVDKYREMVEVEVLE